MNPYAEDARIAALDRRDEIRAKQHRYGPPAGWCEYCCAPPDVERGCVVCRGPDYKEDENNGDD